MYWYGVPHPVTRDNLATCIWQSRAHAVAANSRPYHAKAARLAASSYEMYDLERYTLRKGKCLLRSLPFQAISAFRYTAIAIDIAPHLIVPSFYLLAHIVPDAKPTWV